MEEAKRLTVRVLGGGREVGRTAIAVGFGERYMLLDYGVSFDENDNPVLPLHVQPKAIEALVITHAHLDHIGATPLLFVSTNVKTFASPLTREAGRIMLEDFLKLSGYYLDFEHEEVNRLLSSITLVKHGDVAVVGNAELRFFDAGHIPGSLGVVISLGGVKVAYTGDVNAVETKLVGPARIEGLGADVLIIESTYGGSDHPPRDSVERSFVDSAKEVIDQGGVVLVPAFSLGRGQEIMALLAEKGVYPVYVDGMIRQISEVTIAHKSLLRKPQLLEKAVREFEFVRGWQDRRRVWREPGVIVASAGMLKGGPSRYYLKKLCGNRRNAVFLVSYQARGTPGRELLEKGGLPEIPRLECRLQWFDFSSHAGRSDLVRIVRSFRGLRAVILVHGEAEAQETLAEELRTLGIDTIMPSTGETVSIEL